MVRDNAVIVNTNLTVFTIFLNLFVEIDPASVCRTCEHLTKYICFYNFLLFWLHIHVFGCVTPVRVAG